MMNPEGNIELYKLLKNWNPLNFNLEDEENEAFDFDAEIYDSMDALFKHDRSVEEASLAIQNIFNFSFEEKIPLDRIRPVVTDAFEIIELYREP
ncbi:DUF1871 family protein [Salinicoccus sp. HZC-1]|uniref:DUF1871 family protein n=1 Tax=Salinicoccus sp. HZC-1 TaxID=3385497 RepID=UPI00398B4C5D